MCSACQLLLPHQLMQGDGASKLSSALSQQWTTVGAPLAGLPSATYEIECKQNERSVKCPSATPTIQAPMGTAVTVFD